MDSLVCNDSFCSWCLSTGLKHAVGGIDGDDDEDGAGADVGDDDAGTSAGDAEDEEFVDGRTDVGSCVSEVVAWVGTTPSVNDPCLVWLVLQVKSFVLLKTRFGRGN